MTHPLARQFLSITVVLLILSTAILPAYGQTNVTYQTEIARYEWSQPVEIDAVLSIPHLRLAIKKFSEADNAEIIIRYPGGEFGNGWAIELKHVLVSLGIPSANMQLEPDFGEPDELTIIVVQNQVES